MALVTVNIDLALPTGGWVSNARVEFTLLGFDTNSGETIIDEIPVYAVLDTSGVGSIDIWSNFEGIRGTIYRVDAVIYTDDSYTHETKRIALGAIQIPLTPSSQTLRVLLNAYTPTATGVFYSTITEAQYNAAIQAAIDAQTAADEAASSVLAADASAITAQNNALSSASSALSANNSLLALGEALVNGIGAFSVNANGDLNVSYNSSIIDDVSINATTGNLSITYED